MGLFLVVFADVALPAQAGMLDPSVMVQQFWGFITTGHYAAALGPAIVIAVWLVRKYDTKIPKIGPALDSFFNQPLVAFALPSVLSALGGFGTAVAAGQPMKAAFEPAVEAAMTAVFTFLAMKNGVEQFKLAVDAQPPADPPAAPTPPDRPSNQPPPEAKP